MKIELTNEVIEASDIYEVKQVISETYHGKENFPFDREEHKRWLYTVYTRPEKKLVLIR